MKRTNIIKTITSIIFASALFAFTSCTLGLGEAVDLHGPTVAITAPEARENVKDKFRIAGTVQDDFDIWYLTVTIKSGTTVKGEWRNENNAWKYRANPDSEYTPYENATWNLSTTGKAAEWEINDASITGQGTFTIIVSAVDKSGNASEESTKSRDVIIDGEPPKISVSSPKLSNDKETFNIAVYKDITKISLFQTGDFTISGNAKDDNSIAWLELYIKDAETGEEYFKAKQTLDDVDSLRSWEIPVTLSKCGLEKLDDNKHVLQIFTKTADAAGNTNDDLVSQGYTCLWKEADNPWIEYSALTATTSTAPMSVYTGSPLQFSAYDDSALGEVTVTVRKDSATGAVIDGFEDLSLWTAGTEDENNAQVTFSPPEDCQQYYVVISAKDKKGNDAEQVTGYIKVEDKTFPSVDIQYGKGKTYTKGNTLYSSSDTLYGDTNGDFIFKLTAYDDTNVKSLKMAYIVNKDDVLQYADKTNPLWSGVTTTVTTDSNENKRWEIPVGTSTGTDDSIGIIRKVFEPTLALNIFSDLGINGSSKPLGTQTFVFRVEDNNGNAVTKTYSIQGDIEAPKIEFTGLKYYADGKNETTLTANQDLPAFGANTKIVVSGKISDNSSSSWGTCKKMIADGRLTFTIKANDSEVESSNIKWIDESNGKFEVTIKPALGASSLTIVGKVKDYAKLEATASLSRLVDTTTPKVEYISSNKADGCYKADDTIDIFVKFNKQMKFSGSTAPTLTLNNNKTATMSIPSEATDRFTFTYTVADGDDEDKLNVEGYNLNSGKILNINDVDITDELNSQLTKLVKEDNLASLKDICVITKVPALQSAVLTESTGKLVLTYDKAVARGSGNVTITQLKSDNSTKGIEKVPAVLTKAEYNKLLGKNADFKTYYKAGTNGATEVSGTVTYKDKDNKDVTLNKWQFDTSEKYILDYSKSTSEKTLTDLFEKVNAHILTQNIKSNKVSFSNDNKTVTISFDVDSETGSCLPCKGAKYMLEIPEGFVQDVKGGDNFKVAEYKTNGSTEKPHITAAGYEKPVIRIKTAEATFDTSTLTASQPLTSEFKIDWETPGSNAIKYKYDLLTAAKTNVTGNQTSLKTPTTKQIGTGVAETDYASAVSIGSGASTTVSYKQGETYRITASVMPTTGTTPLVSAYNIAYRTTIVATGIGGIDTFPSWTNTATWLSGGDHVKGPNTTAGFPLTWDATKPALMTKGNRKDSDDNEIGDVNDWYYVTWGINGDDNPGYTDNNANKPLGTRCYVGLLAGTVDASSETDGPAKYIYAQNQWITNKINYGINPGGYLTLDCGSIRFETGDKGKVVTVR